MVGTIFIFNQEILTKYYHITDEILELIMPLDTYFTLTTDDTLDTKFFFI